MKHKQFITWFFLSIFAYSLLQGTDEAPTSCTEMTLHDACYYGNLEKIGELLHSDINANMKNNSGQTPLHLVCYWDNSRTICPIAAQLLLAKKAPVDAQDNDGDTPLHYASFYGHLAVAQLLLENHADANAQSSVGDTPLHHASFRGHLEVVRLLIAHGANVNMQNRAGDTPLHDACARKRGRSDVIELLLKHGADQNIKNHAGLTPGDIAKYRERCTTSGMVGSGRTRDVATQAGE